MPHASPAKLEATAPARASLAAPAFAALLGFLAGDALRPVPRQLTARVAVRAIDAYRGSVSPALEKSGVITCLFDPTCSAYGREAILRYGSPHGIALAGGRVLRCHPWSKGGPDPVP